MNSSTVVDTLITRYKATFVKNGFPDGFFETIPPIPWIGQKYSQFKILIYASAENLSQGWITKNLDLFTTPAAYNRHTEFMKREQKIRIQPFDTGGLRLISILCLHLLRFSPSAREDIADYVAVGSLSKFSPMRQQNRNVDVGPDRLRASTAYLQHDLDVLAPRYIINASGKPLPLTVTSPIISIPQYTHSQLGFYHLRSRVGDEDVSALRPWLQDAIQEYKEQLSSVCRKMRDNVIRSADFVRYFCLAYKMIEASVASASV